MTWRYGRSAAPTEAGDGGGGVTGYRARSLPGGATAAGGSRREGDVGAGGLVVGDRRSLPGRGQSRLARSGSWKGWSCRASVKFGRGEATVTDGRGRRRSWKARSGAGQGRHCRARVMFGSGEAPVTGDWKALPVFRRWESRRTCPGASAGG
jgi:hypothetical protein